MKTDELEKNLWNIANALAAYPIAQGVFISYKFSESSFREHFVNWPAQMFFFALLVSGGYLFTKLLALVHTKMVSLSAAHADVLQSIHRGRIRGVWTFGVILPLIALVIPKFYQAILK